MMELADMPDLGSGERSCRFDPCHPHQVLWLFMRFHEESFNAIRSADYDQRDDWGKRLSATLVMMLFDVLMYSQDSE